MQAFRNSFRYIRIPGLPCNTAWQREANLPRAGLLGNVVSSVTNVGLLPTFGFSCSGFPYRRRTNRSQWEFTASGDEKSIHIRDLRKVGRQGASLSRNSQTTGINLPCSTLS